MRFANQNQQLVLREIAGAPRTSAGEIADTHGKSYESVRAILSAWSRRTTSLGVKDPVTGEPS